MWDSILYTLKTYWAQARFIDLGIGVAVGYFFGQPLINIVSAFFG